jgi:acyl-coenzyme A synthetase/AMP-(fatty) acid ligase
MLSVVEPAPFPPCPAPFSLAGHVLARAADLPDKIALQVLRPSGAERWSYGRLDRAVRGVAFGLAGMGLAPGERVLLRLGNSVDFPLAFLGAVAAGLLPVVTPAGLTVPEISRLAAEVGPALIVGGEGISLPEGNAAPVMSAADLRAMAERPAAGFLTGDPDRPAYLIYTSGTSGQPRAVVHAHRAIWARRMMWQGWYDLAESDRLLHAGALNWTFTLGTGLFDPWAAGATALIPEAGVTPEQLPLLLKRFDATLFAAAPAVYRQMLKSGRPLRLPRLRHGLAAGEKLPDLTRAAWTAATGTPVHEAFGLSECSTFVSASPARPAPPGAVGYAQPGRRIAVLGADGRAVARGTPGTLAVHRTDPGLFLTYHGAEAEARARFSGDWFLTGDQVAMAEDGAITCLGRDDDMMNAGGFRVSPVEVETALAACPGAGEVAVVEVRKRADTSVITAFYTGPADPQQLADHAARTLARYKQPREYLPRPALPHTANGKLNRRALREENEAKT